MKENQKVNYDKINLLIAWGIVYCVTILVGLIFGTKIEPFVGLILGGMSGIITWGFIWLMTKLGKDLTLY